jgi:hypothetical protein
MKGLVEKKENISLLLAKIHGNQIHPLQSFSLSQTM